MIPPDLQIPAVHFRMKDIVRRVRIINIRTRVTDRQIPIVQFKTYDIVPGRRIPVVHCRTEDIVLGSLILWFSNRPTNSGSPFHNLRYHLGNPRSKIKINKSTPTNTSCLLQNLRCCLLKLYSMVKTNRSTPNNIGCDWKWYSSAHKVFIL